MIIQYLRFLAFLAWVLPFSTNVAWATVSQAECKFMEGVAMSESQMQQLLSGSCDTCECIRESFIQTDLTNLNEKYKSQLAETLRIRFEKSTLAPFMRKMREFKVSSGSCGLKRLNQMNCQSEKMSKAVYDTFLGRKENEKEDKKRSCFPEKTLQRAMKLSDLEKAYTSVKDLAQLGMLDSVEVDSYGPLVRFFINNSDEFREIPESYEELKRKVLDGSLKEKFNRSFSSECDKVFTDLEELYCKRPDKLYSSEESFAESFGFYPDKESFPLGATYEDLEKFTLKCTLERCADTEKKRLCQTSVGDNIYEIEDYIKGRDSLMRQRVSSAETEQEGDKLNKYCPLLECENIDEAKEKISDNGLKCNPASPQKTLEKLIADLNCGEDGANYLCQRDPLGKIIEAYDPSDEALPAPELLLGQKDLKDLDIEDKKEILRSHGLSNEELDFLGESGIKYAFGEKLTIDAPKLSQEEIAFQELGAEGARELEQERQEALQAEVEGNAVPENNRFAKAFNSKSKSARTVKAKNNQKPPQKQVTKTNQARAKRAFQANANNPNDYSRSLAQFSDDKFQPAESDRLKRRDEQKDSNSGIKELTNRLKELRKKADRMKAEKDQNERKELEDRISELERNIADVSSSSRAERRRDRDESNTASVNPNRAFLPRDESERRIGQAAEENSENTESQERESESLGTIGPDNPANSSAQTGRSPASNPEASSALNAPEGTKYYEQESEQLPLFTLDSLDGLKPGEGFILGVREGADLKQVLMKPITSEQGTFYDSADLENLSPQARASLLESPFFQKYAHPELKIKLEESVRESKKHDDLIKLLGEQT